MSISAGLLLSLCAAGLISTAAGQETIRSARKQYTARELFYAAAPAQPVAPAVAASPKAPAKPAPQRAAKGDRVVVRENSPAPKPVETESNAAEPRTPSAALPGGGKMSNAAAVTPATAPAPASGAPALGIRYTVLKGTGDPVEVASDTIFHAGDRIRLSVETNGPGYLYIINQGSSGTWKAMFPSPEVEDGNNRVEGMRAYTMPPKSRMVFDETKGTENVFIVFSRQIEPDLEKMIYSLRATRPAAGPKTDDSVKSSKQLLTANNIDDATVGRLRTAYARDLIIERVNEDTPGDKKEKAVYVVNPSGSSDSRVVADLHLVHQ